MAESGKWTHNTQGQVFSWGKFRLSPVVLMSGECDWDIQYDGASMKRCKDLMEAMAYAEKLAEQLVED